MIGDNKPVASVEIGSGVSAISDIAWTTTKTLRGVYDGVYTGYQQYWAGRFGGGDFVTRADGKVLVTYCNSDDNKIYLSVVDSEDDIFYAYNESAVNEWVFLTVADVRGFLLQQSRFQKLADGTILFYVMDGGDDTNPLKLDVYKSANGLGTDFTLLKNLYTYDILGGLSGTFSPEYQFIGWPLELPSGRIIVSANVLADYGNGANSIPSVRVFYTDDNWLTVSSTILYQSNYLTYARCGRGLARFGNTLVACVSWSWNTGGMKFMYSEDEGATWTSLPNFVQETGISGLYDGVFHTREGINFWLNFTDGDFKLYYAPDTAEIPKDGSIYDRSGDGLWKQYTEFLGVDDSYEYVWITEGGNLAFCGTSYGPGGSQSKIDGGEIKVVKGTLQPKSITINRSKGMAGGLTLEFDNKSGVLAPDGTVNPQLLWPNKQVVVKQGYGEELITTFTGLIDSVSMSTFPQSVTVSARDMMKPLLDHYLRNAEFLYTLTYTNMTVEHIWENLMILAGVETNIIEETGLTISEKTFSWETYADAISWLDEIAGFETYCDEDGKLNFVRDGRPVDVTTAYSFVEGVDITRLSYEINDQDLYYTVAVYGRQPAIYEELTEQEIEDGVKPEVISEEMVIYFARQFPQADYWNIPSGKVMRIDAPDADTQAKCEIIADKAIYLIQTRARQVNFETIGIPHLQRGDFIQVTESSSTISEIYRITDISTSQENGKYTMNLTCYYHSAPEVVE